MPIRPEQVKRSLAADFYILDMKRHSEHVCCCSYIMHKSPPQVNEISQYSCQSMQKNKGRNNKETFNYWKNKDIEEIVNSDMSPIDAAIELCLYCMKTQIFRNLLM